MRAANDALIRKLVLSLPSLARMLKEHADANKGEVLPHLFLGEVTQWFVEAVEGGRSEDARQVLVFLEEQFLGDPAVRELIAVSFLENLPWEGEMVEAIRSLMGDALQEEWHRMGA